MGKKKMPAEDIGPDNPFTTPLSVVKYLKKKVESEVDGFNRELDEDDADIVEAKSYLETAETEMEEGDLMEAIDFILQANAITNKLATKQAFYEDEGGVETDEEELIFPEDE
ncbi:MAG: hypothetical protein GYA36_19635 [Veillonellaceae bacterium]|nr:hypothetical protein [Veillonellaceae bacterium]